MIASLKSALADALSLARLLREAAARVKAAEARAEQSDRLFRLLAVEHARTPAARQDDRRKHERELAEEHEQAQRAIRDRDRAEQERDAARGSLNSVLADIKRACALGMCRPGAGPVEIVETMTKREIRRGDELRAARAEASQWMGELLEARHQRDDARRDVEHLSAELRALKSQGGGRS